MDSFSTAAVAIIKEQERIIGPLALEQANKVEGMDIDWKGKTVSFTGDKKQILGHLVEQYRDFFGQTSVEVCRDAVGNVLDAVPAADVPNLLR